MSQINNKVLTLDDINNELNNLKVNSKDFWKMLVLENIQANIEQYEERGIQVTMQDINRISESIPENDFLWQIIDSEISRIINEPNRDSQILGTEDEERE